MANRLYPPIINYSMPAFLASANEVRIYFAHSDFNNTSDIKEVQMTVRYLSNNESALRSEVTARILSCQIHHDTDRLAQADRYYVILPKSVLLTQKFQAGVIYKIQLRFSSVRESGKSGDPYYPSPYYINTNLLNFSEWSTVSLIRPIAAPSYSVLGLEDSNVDTNVTFASLDSVFTVSYSQGDSSEPLKMWRAILYDENIENILSDSGWTNYTNYDYLAVDNKNSVAFDIILPYVMTSGNAYVLRVFLETRNGYSTSTDYRFTCLPITSVDFAGNITLQMIESEGYALLHVTSENPYFTNLVLRRTSSESNFTIWEDVSLITVLNNIVDWTFKDFTIESGVWYRYGVQTRDTIGRRGALTVLSSIEMAEFEDAFLLEENNKQLKLKYDFKISSANVTVAEAKTDTIGSKYPFVRRNGNMYYRTFQCTGLITGYMDLDAHIFTSNKELYNENQDRYAQVRNLVNASTNQYDYTYEREFREKVQEFLYNNKVKLFKSLQEGNILVKLMNISLTPKNELGRLIYSFSAQAIEIDEPTLSILQAYNIQPIIAYKSNIVFEDNKIGQLSSYTTSGDLSLVKIYSANENIIQFIGQKFGWVYNNSILLAKTTKNNVIINDFQLKYLRIEFESDPYLIVKDGNSITPLAENESTENKVLVYGWIVNINDVPILVAMPNNIYEIKEEDFVLASNSNISFPRDTQATIYYTSEINQEVDPNLTPISLKYQKIVGQLNRNFPADSLQGSLILLLQRKYEVSVDTTQVIFDSLLWADIEADEGTIFYAKSSASSIETKFIMNDTSHYLLQPNIINAKIDTLYFMGKQIDVRYLYPEYKWSENEGESIFHYNRNTSLNQFIAMHDKGAIIPDIPRQYDYYDNNGQLLMYYDHQWYPCHIDENNEYLYEIRCPVRAIVNYMIQRREGVYQ